MDAREVGIEWGCIIEVLAVFQRVAKVAHSSRSVFSQLVAHVVSASGRTENFAPTNHVLKLSH